MFSVRFDLSQIDFRDDCVLTLINLFTQTPSAESGFKVSGDDEVC